MGPRPPDPIISLKPHDMMKALNDLRDYAVAIHVEGITIGPPIDSDSTKSGAALRHTPSGMLIELIAGGGGGSPIESNLYSFKMLDGTDKDGPKVLIIDGEINGELPDGMGNDDYVLPINSDGDEVYAIITYDTDSFEITSRSIATAASTPDSTFGVLYVRIGYVNFVTTFTPSGLIVTVGNTNVTATIPQNTQCGDINFNLTVGSLNGKPSVAAVPSYSDYIELPALN